MPLKVDLHTHTVYSDGAHTPAELVQMAHRNGLSTIAITDHDSVNALKEASECGHDLGLEVIPGLELSTDVDDKEVHILAYFIDVNDEELQKYLSFFRDERFHRARRIVQKLRNLGQKISIEDVMEKAKNSAVGRPHIAYTMVDLGIVKNYQEAFERFIGDRGPAFERKIHVSPQSALKLISDSGGLSFVAHPGYMKEQLLTKLIEAGIDGIEVIHPSHNENQVQFYRGITNQYCLLETGGSDFHGGKKMDNDNLGKYYISSTQLELMRKMIRKNNS
jgi:3',5'-nucleoside bisphosphate phosphatase